VRYGVVKNAVLPWGDPSAVIFTPPTLRCLSYLPHPLTGLADTSFPRSVMNRYATTSIMLASAAVARWITSSSSA
jgi:hypothetical protein